MKLHKIDSSQIFSVYTFLCGKEYIIDIKNQPLLINQTLLNQKRFLTCINLKIANTK